MLHDVCRDQEQNITILSKSQILYLHRPMYTLRHGALYGMLLNCSFSAEKMVVIPQGMCMLSNQIIFFLNRFFL